MNIDHVKITRQKNEIRGIKFSKGTNLLFTGDIFMCIPEKSKRTNYLGGSLDT